MWWGFRGIPPAQMNSMVPGTHMGRLLSPKPTLFNYFQRISSFPGKLQVAPASLAYFPLWGPAAVAGTALLGLARVWCGLACNGVAWLVIAWPGLSLAWPRARIAWPGLVTEWLGRVIASPGPLVTWADR